MQSDREFLEGLKDPEGYVRLLSETDGGFVPAAYRLATARLRCAPVSSEVPTAVEIYVAACAICRNARLAMPFSPTSLQEDCEALGLKVI